MNKFEAETKKQYSHVNGTITTARNKIAYAINTDWIYSMHWKRDTWVEQAKRDLEKRLMANSKDYNLLKQAQELLESIDKEPTHD